MLGAPEAFRRMSIGKRNKFLDRMCAGPHGSVFNRMSHGSKAKKYFCFSHFGDSYYHPDKKRKEELLVCINQILSSSLASQMVEDDLVSFVVARHAIERFFLRSAVPTGSSFESYKEAFTNECEFLNFYETVFVTMLASIFIGQSKSEVSEKLAGLSLFLPTQGGAFLAEAFGPTLDIRTYLAAADLTLEQSVAREKLLPIAAAFSKTPIHHFLNPLPEDGLLKRHATWSYQLFTHCINHNVAEIIDAMFWSQDDWLIFNIETTWKLNHGFHATVPAEEILSFLMEGDFENSFRASMRAGARQKS